MTTDWTKPGEGATVAECKTRLALCINWGVGTKSDVCEAQRHLDRWSPDARTDLKLLCPLCHELQPYDLARLAAVHCG